MNKLEIEIPVGKEVDWEASAKQKQIVLKDKQLTYKDICKKLFEDGHYYTDEDGELCFNGTGANTCPNNAATKHQLECLLAKNQLANVAKYLNDGWEPIHGTSAWIIECNFHSKYYAGPIIVGSVAFDYYGLVIFKSSELAEQAIKILGEETVKLALEPLY